jgi:hypothetical protein
MSESQGDPIYMSESHGAPNILEGEVHSSRDLSNENLQVNTYFEILDNKNKY